MFKQYKQQFDIASLNFELLSEKYFKPRMNTDIKDNFQKLLCTRSFPSKLEIGNSIFDIS